MYIYTRCGVTEKGEAAFNGCTFPEKIVKPCTVRKMTEGGFYGNVSLKELTISSDIEGLIIQPFETCPLISVTAGGSRYKNGIGKKLN